VSTASSSSERITSDIVRESFNDEAVVLHYTRAALQLGLWASERFLIGQWFPDVSVPLLELGCGAGRVTFGLCDLGYQNLTAVDFAEELLSQARRLAELRAVNCIRFVQADATTLSRCHLLNDKVSAADVAGAAETMPARPPVSETAPFAGALFLFNGLMQIPGRESRLRALREIRAVCRPDARFLFTTHDRDDNPHERRHWDEEAARWACGTQDPRLIEFGDRYFENDHGGRTFMHLPTRAEVIDDLCATGWTLLFDAMRRTVAPESAAVREFSDECRFWVARRQ
jgi:SAM-dependent methyltransferase